MKKIILTVCLVLALASVGQAQVFGTNYLWFETFTVTTDSTDTTFTDPYYSATLYFSGCTGYVKCAGDAAADTNSFNSKPFLKLLPEQTMTIGSATKLERMEFYGSSSGTLYIVGYKRESQY